MANPTGKNQFTGGSAHANHSAKLSGPAAAKPPKPKKPKNGVTVLHGTWQGPPNARVFVPSGKTSKVRGPSKYG